MSSAAASLSADRFGSCTDAPLRAVFRSPTMRSSRPGRERGPSLSSRGDCLSISLTRRRSWGSNPFAGLLPQPGGPTFLPARAHLPFVPNRPPRLIFVGMTKFAFVISKSIEKRRAWSGTMSASASGLRSRLRSDSTACDRLRIDPALGFASCRVSGTIRRAFDRARPRSNHQPPGKRSPQTLRRAPPNPLMGFRRPSRQRQNKRRGQRTSRMRHIPGSRRCLRRTLTGAVAVPSAY